MWICAPVLLFFLHLAIDIVGHESPIIVGLSRKINCTTILNVRSLMWMLLGVGSGDPVEERSDGGKSLELLLTPEATELNGAKFTCRVTTENGKVFEETITVEIKGEYVCDERQACLYKYCESLFFSLPN